MVSKKGSPVHRETTFQRLDVSWEGYLIAIVISLVSLIFTLWILFRVNYGIGHISFEPDELLIMDRGKTHRFTISELQSFEINLLYGAEAVQDFGRQYLLMAKIDSETYKYHVAIEEKLEEPLLKYVKKFGIVGQPHQRK